MNLRRSRDQTGTRDGTLLSPVLPRERRNPVRERRSVGKIASAASVFVISAACAYCFSRPRKRRNARGDTPVLNYGGQDGVVPVRAPDDVTVPSNLSPDQIDFPDSYQIFSTVPKPGRRKRAFFFSIVLHCSFVFLLGQGMDVIADASAEP